MVFKIDAMKRIIESKTDKNQNVWEEFVSKNNIKKKIFK